MSAEFLENLFGLGGQTAVVIGGTGVLGGALAEGLAQAGAYVVVAGRGKERGEQRVEAIHALGGAAAYLPVDVASRESIETLLAETLDRRGRVDMLVNGAGVNSASPYFEVRDEDWDWVIDSNLKAVHWGCQIFGKQMAESPEGGSILNIASVTADKPLSRVFAYSASKAAVANLTQNVARELAPRNVRVNALCPGFFPAEQNRKILDAERTANIMRQTPMARFGEPPELVGAALLLLSRRAGSFITGASYYVDGGFTAMRL
ncbi:MAG TPA: SDR family oxidoreductase [Pirellulales bacterium]|nr:SDR family oxidoreductase [Pirellulales bacterium]